MLHAERVVYRHAGAPAPALRAIDLDLHDGEVVGLVGPNEAGKSTLCLVLAGLAPRVVGGTLGGRVVIDGEDAAGLASHELASRVGIVLGDPSTQRSGVTRTVYEEVAFGPSNLAVDRSELLQRTNAALEDLEIGHLADRDPRRLSGGQQQLVAMASILAMRPRHLVLDEPTSGLDPAGTRLVASALGRLAAAGVSILIAEHKTDLLAGLADRVIVLNAGQVALSGATEDVLGDPGLAELGVAPPSAVRLMRRLAAAGIDSTAVGAILETLAAFPRSAGPKRGPDGAS
jgi:energy-coupling factor transporter ATP-binding protein EcfA2